MKHLQIDFARSGWRNTVHRTKYISWAFAALAVGMSTVAGYAVVALSAQERAFEEQLFAVRAKASSALPNLVVPVAQSSISATEAAAINAIVFQLNLPWREMHAALSAATPRTIALLSVEPDPRAHTLHVTAEARGSEDMVEYIAELKRQEVFSDAVLISHEIDESDTNRPLRFQLDVTWAAE